MKIALFGGSFNPIHYGHLVLAESARVKFSLDKIIFIPAGIPPHKNYIPLAPKKHRLNLVKLAIQNNKYFSVSDYELKKKGKSYTYQTIEYFKKTHPEDEIFFLMGIDLLAQVNSWKKGDKILDLCKFLVGKRISSNQNIPSQILKKVYVFDIPLIDISSTLIRDNIKKGQSIKYLTPEKVEKYILKNKLYT